MSLRRHGKIRHYFQHWWSVPLGRGTYQLCLRGDCPMERVRVKRG